mgnify:CR=1 FL=1
MLKEVLVVEGKMDTVAIGKALEADTGETLGGEFGALFDWLAACLERGSVEEYEFRVSCY